MITDKSSSNSDWKNASTWLNNNAKYQLTSLGDYKWKLTIPTSLRSFYQVAATDSIKYLAFILRDRKGSAVAKDVEDKDILVKVYSPGLQVKLKSLPSQNLLKKDSVLKIDAVAT